MVIIGDVEVEIVSTSTGEALLEYANPDPDAVVEPMSVEKYIQAVTDEEFHIVVTLREGFNYHRADGVRISYDLDGDMLEGQLFFRRPDRIQRLKTAQTFKIESAVVEIDQTWKRIRFSFGSVGVDEDNHTEKSKLEKQFRTLGSIKVNIERVKHLKRKRALHAIGPIGVPLAKVDKKLLAKSISHTLKPAGESLTAAPPPSRYRTTKIGGQHGKPLTAKFWYRSHLGLQTLGCIQRTPSPVPLSERAPATLTEQEKIDEVMRMRAALEDLSNENQNLMQANQEMNKQLDEVKEVRDRMPALVGGSSGAQAKSVKREQVEEEEQDSVLGVGAPLGRQIKRVKTYDLTGDD